MLFRSLSLLGHNLFFGLAGIIGLTFLVAIHEFGHFIFCKIFKVRTPTFSIGFGPQLASKKIGDTNFVVSAIPLGGFVEIAGNAEIAQGEQKEAQATDEHSFAVKPYWQKLLIMVAGIAFNLIFAYLALIMLFFIGLPKTEMLYPRNANTTISKIFPDTPAEKIGLSAGDQIIAINGISTENQGLTFMDLITPHPSETITLTVIHEGQTKDMPVQLAEQKNVLGDKIGSLGVQFEMVSVQSPSFFQAIKDGIALTNAYIVGIARAFCHIFVKRDVSSMGGPVQIISAMTKGAGQSFFIFLLILAMISINLAVLNLIPLPILDGGQILYFTIEAIIRRPLPLKVREIIHIISWLFALGLILFLSAQDLYRIFKPYLEKMLHMIGF